MDLHAAQRVIDNDDVLDKKSLEIEEQCLRLLALQQPMASDLRSLMTAVKLNWELERSGDLVVNICKAVRRIYGDAFEPRLRGLIEHMSEHAFALMKRAVDAYATGDVALASALDGMDDALDTLHADYVHTIIEVHDAGKLKLQSAVQLALIGRYYERIGDHAVNIGERTQYLVTGWLPEQGTVRIDAEGRVLRESGSA
jgi:phosphate transport system protein